MKYYKPDGIGMWDTWCVQAEDTAHMYHLQFWGSKSEKTGVPVDSLGHAVSKDLINWTQCNDALYPNIKGTDDDMQPWTGCTLFHDNKFYMFYTMRSQEFSATRQKIGLATSDDGYNFTRYENNPVIVPDSQWYINDPDYCGCIDCRDLVIVKYEEYWLGYYATRVHGKSSIETSTVACVRSYDLKNWEHLPPVFVPEKYNCIEVPDVFFLNGKWYLTALVGNTYGGNRNIYTDTNAFAGTIYAISDNPFGPFKEFEDDNVLICGEAFCGYSCRTVLFNEKRYVMFTQPSIQGGPTAVMSRPYLVDTDERGHLTLKYPEELLPKKNDKINLNEPRLVCAHPAWNVQSGEWILDGDVYKGNCEFGWQCAHVMDGAKNIEIEAEITLKEGTAAGITVRADKDNGTALFDHCLFLDAKNKKLAFAEMGNFHLSNARDFDIEYEKSYKIHLVKNDDHIDVYLNGDLYIQTAMAFNPAENFGIGIFVDRGKADIKFTRINLG